MAVWVGRLFRVWLLLGLPFAAYFGYQAYDYRASIPEMQQIAAKWQQRAIDQENGAMRGAFDPVEELGRVRAHIRMLEDDSDQYIALAFFFLALPLLAGVAVLAAKWIWTGNSGNRSNTQLVSFGPLGRIAGFVAWTAGTGLLLLAVAAYAPEKMLAGLIASGGQVVVVAVIYLYLQARK